VRSYRILVPLLVAVGAALFGTAPASAEPYPAVPPALTTTTNVVGVGGTAALNGNGFIPGETINLDVSYGSASAAGRSQHTNAGSMVLVVYPMAVVKSVTASSDGTFSTTVTLTQSGRATIVARGLTSGVTATAVVTVGSGSGGSGLPVTGQSVATWVGTGVAAIALGSLLLWLVRSRRQRTLTPVG
jgi:hypothetical protein